MSGAAVHPAAAAPEQDEGAAAELRQRVGDLVPSLRRARELAGDAFGEIQSLLAELERLRATGDQNAALDLLDEIELRLADVLPPSNVNFQKLRLRWLECEQRAIAALARLRGVLTTEFANDALLANTQKLDQLSGAFKENLADTLDAFGNAKPGAARDGLKQQARAIVIRYLDMLETSDLVDHVEENPFEPVLLRVTLMQPLQLLDKELDKGGA